MTDTKNTVSDERLVEMLRGLEGLDGGLSYQLPGDLRSIITELQSLRASIPGGVGVKVKPLDWTCIAGHDGNFWRAADPFGGLPFEAQTEDQKKSRDDWHRRRILSSLDLSPADTQCCMCGKTGLSTIEGDGGTECQLEDGRWTCSEPCWEKAGGYGPDLSPAEGKTDRDMRDGMDCNYPECGCCFDSKCSDAPYAAPSNPVISDEIVEALYSSIEAHIRTVPLSYGIEPQLTNRLRSVIRIGLHAGIALSVNPQSGSDKP